MKILVTGANGFLGKYVVQELLEQNFEVRILVRSKTQIEKEPWSGHVEIFEGDLRYDPIPQEIFSNIDALMHLAASKKPDHEEQFESTVVGTEKLLDAMSLSKTKRLILCSSIAVYDFGEIKGFLSEKTPLESHVYERDGYTIAKIWQEKVARQKTKQHGFDLTVIRPGMLWGEKEEYPLVLSVPLAKLHFLIGPLKSPNLVHVKNCAKALVDRIENHEAIGQTYNVFDKQTMNSWQFMGTFLQTNSIKGIRIPVPYQISYQSIRVGYAFCKWLFGKNLKLPSLFIPCRFEARFKPFKACEK